MTNKINEKLNEELDRITFSSEDEVITRLNKPSLKEKLFELLNKEVTIPLIPVTTVSAIALVAFFIFPHVDSNRDNQPLTMLKTNEIVEKGGNLYWKEWFVEVKEHANQNKG